MAIIHITVYLYSKYQLRLLRASIVPCNALSTDRNLTFSLSPSKCSVTDKGSWSFSFHEKQTVPTGLVSVAPVGPAIPVIATPTSALLILSAPETICEAILSSTAPKLIKSSEFEENLFLNIGTGIETSVNELFTILSEKLGWKGEAIYKPKRDGELLRSVLNNQRAKDQIGWEPNNTLNTGLDELISWLSK